MSFYDYYPQSSFTAGSSMMADPSGSGPNGWVIALIIVAVLCVAALVTYMCMPSSCSAGCTCKRCADHSRAAAPAKKTKKKKQRGKKQRSSKKEAVVAQAQAPQRAAAPRRARHVTATLATDASISQAGGMGGIAAAGDIGTDFSNLQEQPHSTMLFPGDKSAGGDAASRLLPNTTGMEAEGFLKMSEENLRRANSSDSFASTLRPIMDRPALNRFGSFANDAFRKGAGTVEFRANLQRKFAQTRLRNGCDDMLTNMSGDMYM